MLDPNEFYGCEQGIALEYSKIELKTKVWAKNDPQQSIKPQ